MSLKINIVSEDNFSARTLYEVLSAKIFEPKFLVYNSIQEKQDFDYVVVIFSTSRMVDVFLYMCNVRLFLAKKTKVIVIGGCEVERIFQGVFFNDLRVFFLPINLSLPEITRKIIKYICCGVSYVNTSDVNPMTYEERKVLACVLSGCSLRKISELLNKNIKTISSQKRSAMMRLGVKTTAELMIKLRIIELLNNPVVDS